ncbi:MAG TPA: HNH endonuclease signature motif containing protein [Nitrososphaera sp.]|nr:HNH endonuclease signature motif containing protein [Nitrososphaera sp.]
MGIFSDEPQRRTLGIRDRQIVWERAGRKCESCMREITFTELQVGHKTAYSRGGSTTMRNAVCLCYACNKLQGTDSWATFQKKLGRETTNPISSKYKDSLNSLSLPQLKFLANKHNLKVKGKTIEGLFEDHKAPPSKKQYINALSKVISDGDIELAKNSVTVVKPKKRRKSSSWW